MKIQTTKLRYLRMAPRKVRLVANFVKGLSVNEAEAQLLMNPRRPSSVLLKLLRSAVANAKHNSQLSPERLFIKEIRVDQGPMLKRYMPRAMGRASHIQKKSSHIILVLAESEKLRTPRFKITKPERVSKKEKIEKSRRMKENETGRRNKKTKGAGRKRKAETCRQAKFYKKNI